MSLPVSPLVSTIEMMLSEANITTVYAFAQLLPNAPTFIANFIRSEAAAAAIAGRYTMVLNDGSAQTVLTGDVVDTFPLQRP